MRGPWRSAFLALATGGVLLAIPPSAHGQEPSFPKSSGYLVDAADVIPAGSEQQIEASLADYHARTDGEVAVAVVKTVGDTTIENYAEDLFGHWGVGDEKKDMGVLLVIAVEDRAVRIETGYGAGVPITSIEAAQIIDQITPELRAGDYAGAADTGQRQIRRLLGDEKWNAAAPLARQQQPRSSGGGGGSLLFLLLPFIVVMMMNSMGSRRRRRRGMGFGVPIFYGGGLGGGGFGGSSGGFSGGGGGFGGFGGGDSGGGGASGDW